MLILLANQLLYIALNDHLTIAPNLAILGRISMDIFLQSADLYIYLIYSFNLSYLFNNCMIYIICRDLNGDKIKVRASSL